MLWSNLMSSSFFKIQYYLELSKNNRASVDLRVYLLDFMQLVMK